MNEDEFNLDLDAILSEFSDPVEAAEPEPEKKSLSDSTMVFQRDATAVYRPKAEPNPNVQIRSGEREKKKYRTGEPYPERRPRKRPADVYEEKYAPSRFGRAMLKLLGMIFTVLCMIFCLIFVHPATGSYTAAKTSLRAVNIAAEIDSFAAAAVQEKNIALQSQQAATAVPEQTEAEEPEITAPKYFIPETDLVAPEPDPACFGSVMPNNADEITKIIDQARASGLLENQETVFHADTEFRADTAIKYYLDDSLLVICWKEIIDGNTCSCVEVKMADASQFRRKFADDAFGASNTYYATDLAKSVNSVVAMNADYYLFRDFGIVVYDRELYRFNESVYTGEYKKYNCVDTCFVTEDGDLLYFKKGQVTTEEEMRQYIADNRIIFSIAFGPVLVENGEAVQVDWYPVGEIDKGYSRAGIGQVDSRHYFYMSLNHSNEKQARWNINTFAGHFAEKGVRSAYALDGGQTSEIVFQEEPYNYIDFGAERLVSDIIYFATAIPSEEVTG